MMLALSARPCTRTKAAKSRGSGTQKAQSGPIWTPLIPSTMPRDAAASFGRQVPMKRAGQPAKLAAAYVMRADPLSS